MNWFSELLFGGAIGGSIAHSVFILALVISAGVALGKVKIAGISLGVTWILFAGIAFAHFGMQLNEHLIHFVKEFGLILFVYSIGLQVGPGFFSSFKKGGVTLNMLAVGIVLLGVTTTYIIHLATGIPIATMVGIMSGAVTNTPGLGAAQQANADVTGVQDPTIATGYAVASRMTWSLRNIVWNDFPVSQKWFAMGEALAHLDRLVALGEAKCVEKEDGLTFFHLM